MEVAHDMAELKKLIAQLGLTDDMRDSPRYQVDIAANYSIELKEESNISDVCHLVNVSKRGIAIKIKNVNFSEGTLLRLQFSKTLHVVGRVAHIDREDDGYLVGIESLSRNIDIVNQLLAH